ncbi:MAG: hypothetical protein IIB94_14215 [Candidatus Marinimicrobia bacterium]|nr:hypothetical protein [Candidatus Neomarinimicrobiota bacterium]
MEDMTQKILPYLTLLGIGSIIGGFVTFILNKQKEIEFRKLEQKEIRYKSCLLFMDVFFKPENIRYLSSRQPDINNAEDVLEYLKAEYHEMLLYASKGVILSVKNFIIEPTRENFLKSILSMRKDLWINKFDLNLNEIKIDN